MIGSVRAPSGVPRAVVVDAKGRRRWEPLRGAALRSYNREVAKQAERAKLGGIRIAGNLYQPLPRKLAGRLRGDYSGAWTAFPPIVESSRFTITAGVRLRQGSITGGLYHAPDWTDLSARVVSFTVRNSIDDAMATATIRLFMGAANVSPTESLSPFVDTSLYRDETGRPLLDPGTQVALDVGIGAQGDPVGSATMIPIFGGRLDRVNAAVGGGLIELQCRDWGAFYQNVTVNPQKYGAPGGREASLVMQDMLLIHGFDTDDLLVLADDDWLVVEYEQTEVGLLDAMRNVARQAGRDVRYFPSVGKLVYYTPDRADTTSDLIIGPGRYEDVVALEVGDEDVRNYWDVFYQDAEGVRHGPLHAEDADSIARYGNGKPRRARINLTLADNIRDDTAAQTFALAALADTKEPYVSHGVRALFLPMVELNDLHYYSPNNVEYDNAQIVAVAEYEHQFEHGHGMTTIGGRATRAAAYRAYRRYRDVPVYVSTQPPDDAIYAPPGTIHIQTDSLAFA